MLSLGIKLPMVDRTHPAPGEPPRKPGMGETPTVDSPDSGRAGRVIEPVFRRDEIVAERFRIRRFLGQGGTAQVFEAHDLALDQRVALKVVRPDTLVSPKATRDLKDEVRLARRVTHPNVCRTFDVFSHPSAPGALVVAMELLEGETLAHRLRRHGPLETEEALPLARQMAAALSAAHAAGVLHLDFKSSNVVLVPTDSEVRAVVTDFGLALAGVPEVRDRTAPWGTPGYMAPEQRAGESLSPATDVYALGCVFHEMLTGDLPRPEKGLSVTRPSAAAAGLRPPWRRVIGRCLQRDPGERFASPLEAAAGLAPSPRLAWARRGALAMLLLCLLFFTRSPTGPESPGATLGQPKAMQGTGHSSGRDPLIDLVPDDTTARQLYLRGVDLLRQRHVPKAAELLAASIEREPAFAPALAALAEARAQLIDRPGAEAVAERALAAAGGLSTEGQLLVRARVALSRSDPGTAARSYTTLRELYPQNTEYALGLLDSQIRAGQFDLARATLDEVPTRREFTARRWLLAAELANALEESEATVSAAHRAMVLGREEGYDLLTAAAERLAAEPRLRLGEPERARKGAAAALGAFRRAGFDKGVADALTSLAGIRIDTEGYRDEFIGLYTEALDIYQRLGDSLGAASVHSQLGYLNLQRRELDRARLHLTKALELYTEHGSEAGRAQNLGNLGVLAISQGELDEAEGYLTSALELRRRKGKPDSLAHLLNNLANIYTVRGEARRARDAWEEAGRYAEKSGSLLLLSLTRHNLALLAMRRGELPRARELLVAAAAGAADLDIPRLTAVVRLAEGDWAHLAGKPVKAQDIYLEVIQLAESTDDQFAEALSSVRMASLANNRGDHRQARVRASSALVYLQGSVELEELAAARCELLEALLGLGEIEAAAGVLRQATPREGEENLDVVALYHLMRTRYALSRGEPEDARASIRRFLTEVPSGWLVPWRLEARILLANAQALEGATDESRRTLKAVAQEANRMGFRLHAQEAERHLASLTAS